MTAQLSRIIFLSILLVALARGQVTNSTRGVEDVSTPPQNSVEVGPYYALVIGNNNYQYLNKLQTAAGDAKAVGQLLQQTYGFKVKLLLDASRNDILSAMNEYRRTLNNQTNLLIYYAGHGSVDDDNHEAYWLPVDAQADNNVNWISADDITADLRAMPARHILIVSDSCYSGALGQTRGADVAITPTEHAAYLLKVLSSKSRTLMASGGKEPVSDAGGGDHSIFAEALLQGLTQMQDQEFTADDLFEQFVPAVAGRSAQTPHYSFITNSGHEYGDFVFTRQSTIAAVNPTSADISPPTISKPTSAVDPQTPAVTEALHRYVDAYESESVSELQAIWPTLSKKQKNTLHSTFDKIHAIRVWLSCETDNPSIQGDTATWKCTQKMRNTINDKVQPVQTNNVVITLKKSEQGWLIDNVRAE